MKTLAGTRRSIGRLAISIGVSFATILLLPGPAAAADSWLHVRVAGSGAKKESVRINVPLSMVEGILPAIEAEGLKEGRLRLDEKSVEGIDLRAAWSSLRAAEDGEYVTVEGSDGTVRVSKSSGFMLARVEGGASSDRVNVKLPLDVVDALLSAPEGELDVQAALKALRARGDGDLVSIDAADGTTVRIWIDRKSAPQ